MRIIYGQMLTIEFEEEDEVMDVNTLIKLFDAFEKNYEKRFKRSIDDKRI